MSVQKTLPLRVAVVGCGAAVEHLYLHPIRRLTKRGWIKVVAMAEPNASRKAWAERNFSGTRIVEDAVELFSGEQIDLTIITSPPPLHSAHAAVALGAGSHVLCEKPLAETVSSGQAMIQAAEGAGRVLAVGMTRRFYPCLAEARRWIMDGRLGTVRCYSYCEGGVYGWPVTSDAPFRRESSGGGVLLDKGVHALDLLCWLFGSARLISSEDDSLRGGVEGNSILRLEHNGIQGRMQLSWDQELNNSFLIQGQKGDLLIPVGPMRDLFFRTPGQPWNRVPCTVDWPSDLSPDGKRRGSPRTYWECFDFQLIQLLRSLMLGDPVPVNGGEGLEVLGLINQAYGEASPMDQPWLSPAEQDLMNRRHWCAN